MGFRVLMVYKHASSNNLIVGSYFLNMFSFQSNITYAYYKDFNIDIFKTKVKQLLKKVPGLTTPLCFNPLNSLLIESMFVKLHFQSKN